MQPGDEVAGRYRLEELQGHGPMSQVWRAHDLTLDRRVALKMLSPTADLERFRREARSLAGLAHENVMRLFDYGEDDLGPYMALEWLPGGTLEDRLASGAVAPDEAARIASGLAAGLAHLHSRGLVHRDLKPANVLFDEEGRPKLGDFGLVRHAVGSGTLTEAGTLLGTAAYISPEQAMGEPAGPASDVYAFGVILFRMLTGSLPFAADNALALIELHRSEPPPTVEQLNPAASPSLSALVAASLAKDPAARPPDGAALLAGLGTAPAVPASDTEQTLVVAPVEHAAPRQPWLRPAVGTAAVILAAAGALLAWAVARPASTTPGDAPTGGVAGTHTSGLSGSTPTSTHATGTTRAHSNPTSTAKRSTTAGGHTTAARTTAPTTTHGTTTTPTTTASTTTPGTTTQNTTRSSTTAPTTTSSTTTAPPTTTTAGTTTVG